MKTKPEFTGERIVPGHPELFAFLRIYKLVTEKYEDRNKSVLDYGCGSGCGTLLLSQYYQSVTGIDVSREAIDYCRQAYPRDNLDFRVFNPSSQPYPDNSFDYIFSFQVFEHIPPNEAAPFAAYIWNMLKPGGSAVITTPNAHNYYGGYSGNPFHHKEYTRPELMRVFSMAVPSDCFRILAVEDILSTRVYIAIRRGLKNVTGSQRIAGILAKPFQTLEKLHLASVNHKHMLKTKNVDRVIGSYYIQINKR